MKQRKPPIFVLLLLSALLVSAAVFAAGTKDLEFQTGVRHFGTIPESRIPRAIVNAVNDPGRPAADRMLDPGRKPEQLMAFYGIRPGMRVADLSAGGGYTTELLARIVGPNGKVYSQNGEFPPRLQKLLTIWKKRLKTPALNNVVAVVEPFDSDHLLPVKPGSLDGVLINMNYHDLVGRGVDVKKMNANIFKYLKPGGEYGIIDNSAKPGSGAEYVSTLHRIGENFVIRQVERAGFKLVAASNVLRNPSDDRSWFIFKHRGHQDRFILKFIKPQTGSAKTAS
jgi:predicted methyltransferase